MLIEQIANELQCPICLSLLTIPFVISCGHSFCRDCIQNYSKFNKTSKCPLCKISFNSNKINLNVSLQSVLNVINQEETKSKGELIRKKSLNINFFICTSNIPDEQKEQQQYIERFIKQFNVKQNSNLNGRVTHLIQGAIDKNYPFVAKRTLKYLDALQRGLWIINIDWIMESLKCDIILNEEDFEMKGDEYSLGAPKQSRLNGGMKKLLNNFEFYVDNNFSHSSIVNQDFLENLILQCGGTITSFKQKNSTTIIIKIIQDQKLNKTWKQCTPLQISQRWLFDSISSFKLLGFFEYLIN